MRQAGLLAQASWRVGAGRERLNPAADAALCRDLGRAGLRNADADVPVQMIFRTGRTVTLARIFIALAGQFIAATNAIAIASFRSGFDGD
jgi:hypothetical protein